MVKVVQLALVVELRVGSGRDGALETRGGRRIDFDLLAKKATRRVHAHTAWEKAASTKIVIVIAVVARRLVILALFLEPCVARALAYVHDSERALLRLFIVQCSLATWIVYAFSVWDKNGCLTFASLVRCAQGRGMSLNRDLKETNRDWLKRLEIVDFRAPLVSLNCFVE